MSDRASELDSASSGNPASSRARPPKILLVMTQADYRSNGGVRSAIELVRAAVKRGCDLRVVTSRDGEETARLRTFGLEVDVVPALGRPSDDRGRPARENFASALAVHRHVAGELRRGRYDLVQTNDRRAFWMSFGAARWRGCPILDVVRDTQPQLGALRRARWKAEFRLADGVMVLSHDMARTWATETGMAVERFRPVYSIVDSSRFAPASPSEKSDLRGRLGIGSGPVILYPAGVRGKKRQLEFVLHGLSKLRERSAEARVWFVGDFSPETDGYAETCARAIERAGLQDAARFAGHRDDIEDWYRVADVAVLATEKEGLSRAMIESVACGTPVVSFDVVSAREVLESNECGVVVPFGDYVRLADEVCGLIDDPVRRAEMGRRGVLAAHRMFESDQVVDQYLDCVTAVIGRRFDT